MHEPGDPVQFQTGAALDTPHLSQPISYRYSIAAQRRAAWIDPLKGGDGFENSQGRLEFEKKAHWREVIHLK